MRHWMRVKTASVFSYCNNTNFVTRNYLQSITCLSIKKISIRLSVSILCIHFSFVCFFRFNLWTGDYNHRAFIYREGQWSECEIGVPVHPGLWRYWTIGYWMELNGLWQSARGQSGMYRSNVAFVLFIDSSFVLNF